MHETEAMHNITKKDINRLESLDRQLIVKCLETSAKTVTCIMMLDLALIPIRFLIMKKRILYFHHLLKSDEQNLARQILIQQIANPLKKDWIMEVKKDL